MTTTDGSTCWYICESEALPVEVASVWVFEGVEGVLDCVCWFDVEVC